MTLLIWIGLGLAVVLLAAGIAITLTSQRSLIDDRLEQYLEEREEVVRAEEEEGGWRSGTLTNWLSERVEQTDFGGNISRELARADLKLKTGEYVALIGLASLVTGVFGFFFGGNSFLVAIIGLVGGLFIPRIYVRLQQKARMRAFDDQLPDMLNLMVNGLRTGFSALQAMEAVSRELPAPISAEFRRVVREMQLGVPMEGALENLQRRIPSEDLDLAVTAINIQREVGGNLAEILDTISYTIRERIRIKGEVRAVTAQVTYSGRFLSLMPIILGFILWGLNREYMSQFFAEPRICGYGMLGTAAVMLVIGYSVLNSISNIEI
jgi:tight adherence protein B